MKSHTLIDRIKTITAMSMIVPGLALAQAPVLVTPVSSTPTVVITPTGTYIVIPNYVTGQPLTVVKVSNGGK